MKTNIAKMIPTLITIFKNLMIQMMMWQLMEIIFLRITKNIINSEMIYMVFLEYVTHMALNLMMYIRS